MNQADKNISKKEVGQRLRGLRKYYGWQVGEVEVFLPELRMLLSEYECGKQEVPVEMLNQLAALYDFETTKILDWDIPLPVSPPMKKREGLLSSIERMLERAEVTGRYNLLFRCYSVNRVYHNPLNADEILLLIRDYEGDTRETIPLEKFRRWDAKRIKQEFSYLYCQPSSNYLIHIPSLAKGIISRQKPGCWSFIRSQRAAENMKPTGALYRSWR